MPDDARTDEDRESDAPVAPDAAEGEHDDIMKRLLDYQRNLRGGAEPTEAAAAAWPSPPQEPADEAEAPSPTPDLVDLSTAEPEIQAESQTRAVGEIEAEPEIQRVEDRADEAEVGPPQPIEAPVASWQPATRTGSDVAARIAELESTLDRLGGLFGDLRKSFQDLAVAADARLAEIESEIAAARHRPDDGS